MIKNMPKQKDLEAIQYSGKYSRVKDLIKNAEDNTKFVSMQLKSGEKISKITPYAVFLSIIPAYDFKGLAVYDPDGKKVGVVKNVILFGKTNQVKTLVIRSGFLRKELEIPSELIDIIGQSVFLNRSRTEILNSPDLVKSP